MTETRCSSCGKAMACGRDDPAGCWCASLPALPAAAMVTGQGCLCEDCLRRIALSSRPNEAAGET